jgi:hypothetical protein
MAESIAWNWLTVTLRDPCPYKKFSVIDVTDVALIPSTTERHLIELIIFSRISKELLEDAEKIGGDVAKRRLIAAALPSDTKVKRGDFGEVLSGALLSEVHGYLVPVQKLRYAIGADLSQPGTDLIAIRFEDQSTISEICFVESKLRTSTDTGAGVAGYNQLRGDYSSVIPKMIAFVLGRLEERKNSLYLPFLKYTLDRSAAPPKEKFHLALFYDPAVWSETTLLNLEQVVSAERDYPKLSVHAVSLQHLRGLTERVFREAGYGDIVDVD